MIVILIYNGLFQIKVHYVLVHKFLNISTNSVAVKKQNLLTKQEPEGTHNIDL